MNLLILKDTSPLQNFNISILDFNFFALPFLFLAFVYFYTSRANAINTLLSIIILTIGMYVFYSHYIDESFVSPRMSFIFSNYSKLSFFEGNMNQASVEILQTLISSPIFKSTDNIILSYYLIHLLLISLVMFLFVKSFENKIYENKTNSLIFLIILFLSPSFYKSASSGLGLNLLLLLVFLNLYFHYNSLSLKRFTYLSYPLIRPDGILYSFLLFISDTLYKKKFNFLILGSIFIGFLIYYFFVSFYFSQWPPPPMAFKSFSIITSLKSFAEPKKYFEILIFVKDHFLQFFIISLFLIINIGYSNKNTFLQFLSQYKFELLLLTGSFGILLIYIFFSFHQHGDFRYSMIVSLLITFISIKFFISIKKNKIIWISISLISFIHLFFNSSEIRYVFSNQKKAENDLIKSYRYAALKLGELEIKKNVKIASVEMSSFPFYLKRDVYDLYGYSNLEISQNNLCNKNNLKVNPNYIKKLNPEIIFERALPNNYFKLLGEKKEFIDRVKELDKYLLEDYFSKEENNYGDLNFIVTNYNFVFLIHKNSSSFFLVNKKFYNSFLSKLYQSQYKLENEIKFDSEKFLKKYNNIPNKLYKC